MCIAIAYAPKWSNMQDEPLYLGLNAWKEALIQQCAYVRLYTCTRIHLLYLYDCTRVHVPVITCYDVLGHVCM